eukprot:2181442-Ditylum_brightwellii.AAC.1
MKNATKTIKEKDDKPYLSMKEMEKAFSRVFSCHEACSCENFLDPSTEEQTNDALAHTDDNRNDDNRNDDNKRTERSLEQQDAKRDVEENVPLQKNHTFDVPHAHTATLKNSTQSKLLQQLRTAEEQ